MVSSLVLLPLLTCLTSAQLPVPGTIPGLSLDQQFAYIQQLQDHLNTQVQWAGRRKRSLPVPGTTGLVPGSAAEAQWYQQQLAQIALVGGRKKRALPVPGTIPGLVLDPLVKLSGIKHSWLKLLLLEAGRREAFQFLERLVLFQDLPLRLNGTNLFLDLPLRLNGTNNSLLKLL
eukprot:TRINITY_DN4125_c0_g1_i13.p1 TRINITY_DN4125_c0_g1~~TRINITY_DN4125_c0_g1_i13.p1  ORF type:complete len:174 (-),score=57.05 TRINITY_DN4125_c0_g1_i13:196-717(-)